jgi:hypothetical protein
MRSPGRVYIKMSPSRAWGKVGVPKLELGNERKMFWWGGPPCPPWLAARDGRLTSSRCLGSYSELFGTGDRERPQEAKFYLPGDNPANIFMDPQGLARSDRNKTRRISEVGFARLTVKFEENSCPLELEKPPLRFGQGRARLASRPGNSIPVQRPITRLQGPFISHTMATSAT